MNIKLSERPTFSDQQKQMNKTRWTDTKTQHEDKQTKTVLHLPLCSPLNTQILNELVKISTLNQFQTLVIQVSAGDS